MTPFVAIFVLFGLILMFLGLWLSAQLGDWTALYTDIFVALAFWGGIVLIAGPVVLLVLAPPCKAQA